MVADNIDAAGYVNGERLPCLMQQLYEQRQTLVPAKVETLSSQRPTVIARALRSSDSLRRIRNIYEMYYKVLDRWPREAYKF